MLLVESHDFDRMVILTRMTDELQIGFEQFTLPAASAWAGIVPADLSDRFAFVLPSCLELWGGHSVNGVNVSVNLLVTKIGHAVG